MMNLDPSLKIKNNNNKLINEGVYVGWGYESYQ